MLPVRVLRGKGITKTDTSQIQIPGHVTRNQNNSYLHPTTHYASTAVCSKRFPVTHKRVPGKLYEDVFADDDEISISQNEKVKSKILKK